MTATNIQVEARGMLEGKQAERPSLGRRAGSIDYIVWLADSAQAPHTDTRGVVGVPNDNTVFGPSDKRGFVDREASREFLFSQ